MAIWQFRLDLIPTSAIRMKFGTVPVAIPQELAEDFDWWSEAQPPAGFETRLDDILPRANSWSDEMLIWGDERGDTAFVCFDSSRKVRVEWIGFRVDVRRLSPGFVRDICKLANEMGCVLMSARYHLMAADEQRVLAAIGRSTARKYLEDPVGTLLSQRPTDGEVIQFPEKDKGDGGPTER